MRDATSLAPPGAAASSERPAASLDRPAEPEPYEQRSLAARSLVWLVTLCYRRPLTTTLVGILLCVAAVYYSYLRLEFATDRSALVSPTERYSLLQKAFVQEFPQNEDILVVVEGGTEADRQDFVDDLATRLEDEPRYFKDVFARFELPFLRTHALLYLPTEDLRRLARELSDARPLLKALGTRGGLEVLMDRFASREEARPSKLARMLPFLNRVMDLLLESLATRGRYSYKSPWQDVFFGDVPDTAPQELQTAGKTVFYNTLQNGEVHLLLLRVSDSSWPDDTVDRLRRILKDVRPAHPGVHTGLTGETVLDLDEMRSSMQDSGWATVFSLILVSALYIWAFRELARPLMMSFVLLLSLGWTLGYATLAVGHLNLLTVTFGTILVGLGVDFGVQFIYRYEEERFTGLEVLKAMQVAMAATGVENLTGALSMSVAFWALRFMSFRGVAELGDITGAGVMLCFFGMMTVLPAMIVLQERMRRIPSPPQRYVMETLTVLEQWLLARPGWVLAVAAVITLISVTRLYYIRFDYNLLNMQAQQLESVQTELKLIRVSEHSVLYAISLADDLEEAEARTRALEKLPTVSTVESFLPLIPSDYRAKVPLVDRIEKLMRDIVPPEIPQDPPGASSLRGMADGFLELEAAFNAAYPRLIRDPDPKVRQEALDFKKVLTRLFNTLEKMGPGPIMDGLTTFQVDFFTDLRDMIRFLKDQRSNPEVTFQDLPEQLRLRGLGRTGKIMLRIYPRFNLWNREPLDRFVRDVTRVDPTAVGTPILIFHHTESLRRAYEVSGYYAFGVIVVLLLIHFRSLWDTLLALLPKVMGILWMLALMVHYEVDFNPANFMAMPLVLGIGLVFGVHVLQRAREEGRASVFDCSTGPAILLDALTNVAGFGALMAASHQGIASLGFVMTVGSLTNLVTAVVVLPALLQLLKNRGFPL